MFIDDCPEELVLEERDGRNCRLDGKPMDRVIYYHPFLPAQTELEKEWTLSLRIAWLKGWVVKDKALRTGDDY